jgi:hypothetical protein
MRRWLEKWREVRSALVWALSRFPVTVIALGVFALYVNLIIADIVSATDKDVLRAGIALVGAAGIATSAVFFGERIALAAFARHLLSLVLATAVGAALWYWERLAVAFPALFVAVALSIPLAPYLRRELHGFWAFIWLLTHAVALALITIVVFCLGLSAIFATIDYLFGVDVDSSVYGHIWSLGLGFVGPLFALSLVPTTFPEADAPDLNDVFVAGLRILSDFVAVPLLAVYVVILHVYALKILIEQVLPKGQIGWMVLSFGLSVLVLRIIAHPLSEKGRLPTRLFLRYWAPWLVVPLALLVIAVWQRISQYGVTPERYGLALFALFLGLVLLVQLVPRWRGDIRFVPALGALALFLASFGPWGIIPVTVRSQTDRLMDILTKAGSLQDGALVTDLPPLSAGATRSIRTIIPLLGRLGQLDRLQELFAGRDDDPFAEGESALYDRVANALNARLSDIAGLPGDEGYFDIVSTPGVVPIAGYDVVLAALPLTFPEPHTVASFDDTSLLVRSDGLTIVIETSHGTYSASLPVLHDAFEHRINTVETLPVDERPPFFVKVTFRRILRSGEVFENQPSAAILFKSATGTLTEERLIMRNGSYDLYLRSADWTEDSLGGTPLRDAEP